jgi:hypothetical protein
LLIDFDVAIFGSLLSQYLRHWNCDHAAPSAGNVPSKGGDYKLNALPAAIPQGVR